MEKKENPTEPSPQLPAPDINTQVPKTTPNWNLWISGLGTFIVVSNVVGGVSPRDKPVANPEFYRMYILGKFFLTVLAVIALIIIFFQKKKFEDQVKSTANATQNASQGATQEGVVLAWVNTRASAWRCEKDSLRRPETAIPMIIFGVLVSLVAGKWFTEQHMPDLLAYILGLPLGLLGTGVFMLGGVWMVLTQRYPKAESVRQNKECVLPQGILSHSPDQTVFTEWKNMNNFQWNAGDIYFRRGFNATGYIAREAFENLESSKQFFDMLVALKESRGARWHEFEGLIFPAC
jgi:hypothetical protein